MDSKPTEKDQPRNLAIGDTARKVTKSVGQHISLNSAVKPDHVPPGPSNKDVPAGTSGPLASKANPKAVNAGSRESNQSTGSLAADKQTAGRAPPVPPPTREKQDQDPPTPKESTPQDSLVSIDSKPDGGSKSKVAMEPDYLGWKEVAGWNDESDKITASKDVEDMLTRSTLLETYVDEKFYGDWYQNTAIIVVSSFFSWLAARLGGGLVWVVIILAFTAQAYRTSIRRFRRNARDDMVRELGLKKIETDTETLEWLNSFLVKFWLIYEPVLSATIVSTANQILSGATPGFIEGLALTTFTLGTKPPRIESVRTFPKSDPDVVVMDWAFSFTPNDTADLTSRQLKTKVNPKIQLSVSIGKGIVSKKLPILVEDTGCTGRMRVRIKLIPTFPHVQTVDVSFLDPPDFDFSLKPIGGDMLGFDVNVIPGLQNFIKETVDANIGPMMYSPNAYQVNLEEMLAGSGIDSAVGVLSVTLRKAIDLRTSQAVGNTCDPYIKLILASSKEELARTEIQKDTSTPVWNETKYLLIKNPKDVLSMEIVDFNDFRKDKLLGTVNFNMDTILDNPDQENIRSEVLFSGKARGGLLYDVHWYPVLQPKVLEDGTKQPPPETPSGICRFTIEQCKDLDVSSSVVGQFSPYALLALNGRQIYETRHLKRTNVPVWGESYEVLVTNKNKCQLGVTVKDQRTGMDATLGSFEMSLNAILERLEKPDDWFPLKPHGRLRIGCVWKPVALDDVAGANGYQKPIGVLRVHIKRGVKLRNLETVGKVDPYVRMFVNGFIKHSTPVIENTLDPEWDEVLYAPIQSTSQKITLEAMDAESIGKDRPLGSFTFTASDYVQISESGEFVSTGSPADVHGDLALPNKGPRGKLIFNVRFHSALPIMDPEEIEEKKKIEEEKAKKGDNTNETKEAESSVATESKTQKLIEMPLAEILRARSGVLILSIASASGLARGSFLQIYFDKGVHPAWRSGKLASSVSKINDNLDFLIRELEYSLCRVDLVAKENAKSDDIIATVEAPTKRVLEGGYDGKNPLIFGSGANKVTLTFTARFFPVMMDLDPSESITDQGKIRVELLDATELPSADRNGKSDPYAVFSYNGVKMFKSQIQKKTLTPVWNEAFEAEIASRLRADFKVDVYDWDMGPGEDDFLGSAAINLPELEPESPTILVLPLNGSSGSIRLKLSFTPQYVSREVKLHGLKTTFNGLVGTPGRMITATAGVPVKVIGGAASHVVDVGGQIGGGALKGAKFFKNTLTRKKSNKEDERHSRHDPAGAAKRGSEDLPRSESGGVHSLTSDENSLKVAKGHSRSESGNRLVSLSRTRSPANELSSDLVEEMEVQLTLLQGRGFQGISQVQFRIYIQGKRDKEIYRTKGIKPGGGQINLEEALAFRAHPDAVLTIRAYNHKTLGRDEELGEQTLPVGGTDPSTQHSLVFQNIGELLVSISYKQQ